MALNYGKGWVIFEDSYREKTRKLVSILSPRRTPEDVKVFVEQLYIDRYGSIRERLEYKKSRKSTAYPAMFEGYGGVMHCGQEPHLVAIFARSIVLRDELLEFTYQIAMNRTEGPTKLRFEERQQTLVVDG